MAAGGGTEWSISRWTAMDSARPRLTVEPLTACQGYLEDVKWEVAHLYQLIEYKLDQRTEDEERLYPEGYMS